MKNLKTLTSFHLQKLMSNPFFQAWNFSKNFAKLNTTNYASVPVETPTNVPVLGQRQNVLATREKKVTIDD